MIYKTGELLIFIAVIAFVTFLTRVTPFLLFPNTKETPKYILYLGKVLPFAIIGMLVVYCLKNISVFSFSYGVPELISIIFIVLIQLWKRNTLYSIGGGTLLYMALVQSVFK